MGNNIVLYSNCNTTGNTFALDSDLDSGAIFNQNQWPAGSNSIEIRDKSVVVLIPIDDRPGIKLQGPVKWSFCDNGYANGIRTIYIEKNATPKKSINGLRSATPQIPPPIVKYKSPFGENPQQITENKDGITRSVMYFKPNDKINFGCGGILKSISIALRYDLVITDFFNYSTYNKENFLFNSDQNDAPPLLSQAIGTSANFYFNNNIEMLTAIMKSSGKPVANYKSDVQFWSMITCVCFKPQEIGTNMTNDSALVKSVRIAGGTQHLNFSQIVVTDMKGNNIALNRPTISSGAGWGSSEKNVVDGTLKVRASPYIFDSANPGGFFEVFLDNPTIISSVTIYNRDIVQDRLASGYKVILKNMNGIDIFKPYALNGDPIQTINVLDSYKNKSNEQTSSPSASTVSTICGSYGYPNADKSLRIYSNNDCNQLKGKWSSNGECLKPEGGSFSWDCRQLNFPPPPPPPVQVSVLPPPPPPPPPPPARSPDTVEQIQPNQVIFYHGPNYTGKKVIYTIDKMTVFKIPINHFPWGIKIGSSLGLYGNSIDNSLNLILGGKYESELTFPENPNPNPRNINNYLNEIIDMKDTRFGSKEWMIAIKNHSTKEDFKNSNYEEPNISLVMVFNLVCSIFALYLAFKCNNGFEIYSFLLALFCPVLYIIYKFATSPTFCKLRKI